MFIGIPPSTLFIYPKVEKLQIVDNEDFFSSYCTIKLKEICDKRDVYATFIAYSNQHTIFLCKVQSWDSKQAKNC